MSYDYYEILDLEEAAAESGSILPSIILTFLFFALVIGALVGLAFIPASIAKKKGYGFAGFFIFSLIGFFPAFIVALCLNDRNAEIMKIREIVSDAVKRIKNE